MQAVVEETRQEALKEVNQALDYLNPLGLASPGLSISSVSSSTGNLIAATSDAASNVAPSKEALSSVILPLLSPFLPLPFPLSPLSSLPLSFSPCFLSSPLYLPLFTLSPLPFLLYLLCHFPLPLFPFIPPPPPPLLHLEGFPFLCPSYERKGKKDILPFPICR